MTDYLFAKPSFLGGMASVLDLGSTLTVYNNSPTPEIADNIAIYNDCKAVGNDIRVVIEQG
ncbi:hypothetical protein KKB18_04890 [bacterium]|nr:hypothetical protein [bacterium]